jgi:hypothetical protein
MQKEFDEVIKDKNEEISRLKEHSQKLLTSDQEVKGFENNVLKS